MQWSLYMVIEREREREREILSSKHIIWISFLSIIIHKVYIKVGKHLQNSLFLELLIYHKMIHLLDTTAKPLFTTSTFTIGTVKSWKQHFTETIHFEAKFNQQSQSLKTFIQKTTKLHITQKSWGTDLDLAVWLGASCFEINQSKRRLIRLSAAMQTCKFKKGPVHNSLPLWTWFTLKSLGWRNGQSNHDMTHIIQKNFVKFLIFVCRCCLRSVHCIH